MNPFSFSQPENLWMRLPPDDIEAETGVLTMQLW
jgi:hypothetical protein